MFYVPLYCRVEVYEYPDVDVERLGGRNVNAISVINNAEFSADIEGVLWS